MQIKNSIMGLQGHVIKDTINSLRSFKDGEIYKKDPEYIHGWIFQNIDRNEKCLEAVKSLEKDLDKDDKLEEKIEKMEACLYGLLQKECEGCGDWYGDCCFQKSDVKCDECMAIE